MPKSDRKKIYEQLFKDGVCVAKKDFNLKSHPEIENVKNLFVIKALKVSIINTKLFMGSLPSIEMFHNF